MTESTREKWQKALEYWDAWIESTQSKRANFIKDYGDLEQILEREQDLVYRVDIYNIAVASVVYIYSCYTINTFAVIQA